MNQAINHPFPESPVSLQKPKPSTEKKHSSLQSKLPMILTVATLIVSAPLNVYCADTLIKTIIDLMLDIARYSGMALIVWGAIKTILAYKDDNTNEITQGIRLAIVGAMLSAAKTVLAAFI